jgi:tripeptidyl-peptidase-1
MSSKINNCSQSESLLGCHNYSLPSHLRQHVDLIKPTVHFNYQPASNPRLKRTRGVGRPFAGIGSSPEKSSNLKRTQRSLPGNCNQLITPDCLRDLYGFDYTPQSTHNNSFGIGWYSLFYNSCLQNTNQIPLQLR